MFTQMHVAMKFNFKQYEEKGNKFIYRHSLIYFKCGPCEFVKYYESVFNHRPTAKDVQKAEAYALSEAKKYLCKVIDKLLEESKHFVFKAYDLNFWFNSEKRQALLTSLNIEILTGKSNTDIEINGQIYNINLFRFIKVLQVMDQYSKDCHIKATEYKQKVNEMTNIKDVLYYEDTLFIDFPRQFVFK